MGEEPVTGPGCVTLAAAAGREGGGGYEAFAPPRGGSRSPHQSALCVCVWEGDR